MSTISRKAKLAGVATIGSLALILSACGSAPETDPTAAPEPTETSTEAPAGDGDFLACAVSDEGSWNDKSFNEAAFGGLLEAESKLGVQIQGFESATPDDFGPNIDEAINSNCDIIFAVGFNFSWEGSLEAKATANPDVHFAWVDGWPMVENIKPVMYSTEQSSYLAGYLAASYSTTGTVATYGGQDIDSVTVFMNGFKNGAEQYGIDSGKEITVLPFRFVGSFDNSEVAKQISDSFLSEGADVIFPVAGGLFSATDEAIQQSGGNAVFIGVDKNVAVTQPDMAPRVLTSVEKRMTQAVFDIIEPLSAGDAFNPAPYIGTLDNDGTGLSDLYEFADKVDPAVVAKLDELTKAIIDGSLDPRAPAAAK